MADHGMQAVWNAKAGWRSAAGGAHPRWPAWRAWATAAGLAAGLAAQSGPVAAAYGEVFARTFDTRGPQVVCNDFFCHSVTIIPPLDVSDGRSTTQLDTLSAGRPAAGVQASARAVQRILGQTTISGAAAEATMVSVFQSEARARLRVSYIVDVDLDMASPIQAALIATACTPPGCRLGVDFLHQTSGTFVHAAVVPGAQARFAESVQVEQVQVAGEASITADPQRAGQVLLAAGGHWSAGDFLSSATQPRPGGAGPWDTVTLTSFNHFQPILGATALFNEGGAATFHLTVEQTVDAGFGSAGAYSVGPSTIGADFSHTSVFSALRVVDPTGQLDLSGVGLTLRFSDVTPVPEPAAAWLLLAGLPLIGTLRRRRLPAAAAG